MGGRCWPINCGPDLGQGGFYLPLLNDCSLKNELNERETCIFRPLQIAYSQAANGVLTSCVSCVFLKVLGKKSRYRLNKNKPVEHVPEDVINKCLKHRWGIGETEGHHQILKMAQGGEG